MAYLLLLVLLQSLKSWPPKLEHSEQVLIGNHKSG